MESNEALDYNPNSPTTKRTIIELDDNDDDDNKRQKEEEEEEKEYEKKAIAIVNKTIEDLPEEVLRIIPNKKAVVFLEDYTDVRCMWESPDIISKEEFLAFSFMMTCTDEQVRQPVIEYACSVLDGDTPTAQQRDLCSEFFSSKAIDFKDESKWFVGWKRCEYKDYVKFQAMGTHYTFVVSIFEY